MTTLIPILIPKTPRPVRLSTTATLDVALSRTTTPSKALTTFLTTNANATLPAIPTRLSIDETIAIQKATAPTATNVTIELCRTGPQQPVVPKTRKALTTCPRPNPVPAPNASILALEVTTMTTIETALATTARPLRAGPVATKAVPKKALDPMQTVVLSTLTTMVFPIRIAKMGQVAHHASMAVMAVATTRLPLKVQPILSWALASFSLATTVKRSGPTVPVLIEAIARIGLQDTGTLPMAILEKTAPVMALDEVNLAPVHQSLVLSKTYD